MNLKAFKILTVTAVMTTGTLVSCVADSNSPGLEYMPDMYRSPAVEAYVDFAEVGGKYNDGAALLVEDKFSFLPPAGTIPYGSNGDYTMPYAHPAPINADKSHGLYGVAQDSAGRDAAKADVNPIPFSDETLDEGKVLYERFCIHCHGEKGDGQGTVVTNSNGKFPTPGAYKPELTPGEIFYTITYGKGSMGSHASQVNPTERWKIVHYIEELQGKDHGVAEAPAETEGEGAEEAHGEMGQDVIEEVIEAVQDAHEAAVEGGEHH